MGEIDVKIHELFSADMEDEIDEQLMKDYKNYSSVMIAGKNYKMTEKVG